MLIQSESFLFKKNEKTRFANCYQLFHIDKGVIYVTFTLSPLPLIIV